MSEVNNVFGNNGRHGKYLVVDVYHGGIPVLVTNSGIEARLFEVVRTGVEVMNDFLKESIVEFSHKNTDFNRQRVIETEIKNWNAYARMYDRKDLIITDVFNRRQDLSSKFSEIQKSL